MKMKKIVILALICVSMLMVGCEEKIPSDKLTSETIKPIAENEAMAGLVVDEFKKENGWQDTNAANTYNVRYSYNLKLTKPFPEVVLGLANQILSELNDVKNNPGLMDINVTRAKINMINEASSLGDFKSQEFANRFDAFVGKCRPCLNYFNQAGEEDEVSERNLAFMAAWSRLESMGFKDASTIGDKVPRFASTGFMKTEQGWKSIDN